MNGFFSLPMDVAKAEGTPEAPFILKSCLFLAKGQGQFTCYDFLMLMDTQLTSFSKPSSELLLMLLVLQKILTCKRNKIHIRIWIPKGKVFKSTKSMPFPPINPKNTTLRVQNRSIFLNGIQKSYLKKVLTRLYFCNLNISCVTVNFLAPEVFVKRRVCH